MRGIRKTRKRNKQKKDNEEDEDTKRKREKKKRKDEKRINSKDSIPLAADGAQPSACTNRLFFLFHWILIVNLECQIHFSTF